MSFALKFPMASTISFLRKRSKAKGHLDEDMQLSLDETKFEMEFLKGERTRLSVSCGLPQG